ncbi:MAG: phospholipase D family protein [Desulfobacterales bacterium]|nr:phospholipase D family protein [Desulfobacterales bacterium]
MLEPGNRLLYLEELRPPEGYQLDRAIATTFSLDLLSLLMAPLSMVLYESQSRDEFLKDPMAALEAIRRSAGRIGIFCQKGRISVPKHQQLLYNYLEPTVVQVNPPRGNDVFHPKTWLLRFTAEDMPVIYRFLCLSRNLTFDRSWDTVLMLEGELVNRQRAYSRNHPLGDFIKALPDLSDKKVSKGIQEHVDLMSDEVRRVLFEVEPPFSDKGNYQSLSFAPIGLDGYKRAPKLLPSRSMLVLSPFLHDGWLEKEISKSPDVTLVSRSESLNAVSDKTFEFLEKAGVKLYVMDEASEPVEESNDPSLTENSILDSDETEVSEETELSGLHAKLFISEHNSRDVRLWTGSANATNAAFKGVNVEFLVGLRGTAHNIGVSKLLGEGNSSESGNKSSVAALIDLMQPYKRPASQPPEDVTKAKLEKALDNARRAICKAPIKMRAVSNDSGTYTLEVVADKPLSLDTGVEGACVPISLHKNDLKPLAPLAEGENICFRNLPTARLTCFVAFVVKARLESQTMSTSFVLKLEPKGFPEDRNQHVLSSIVTDSDRFLKYLLLLLSESDPLSEQKLLKILGNRKRTRGGFSLDMPLFEELVKSFSRQPQSIVHIAELVDELRVCQTEKEVIPPEFLAMWETFMAAIKLKGDHETKHKQT